MERAALYIVFKFCAAAAGFFSCAIGSYLYFSMIGYFPVKEYMVVFLAIFWALVVLFFCQIKIQKLGLEVDGLKALEVWLFFAVYGATPAALLFSETVIGSPELSIDISMAGPVYSVIVFHLLAGASAILWRGLRNG